MRERLGATTLNNNTASIGTYVPRPSSASRPMSVKKMTGRSLSNNVKNKSSARSNGSGSQSSLYRRAPAMSGGPSPLGSGMWYVWDPMRKKGVMRGYKSLPRNAGFKNTFQTTSNYDFSRKKTTSNYDALKVPRYGRKKTTLR